MQIEAFEKLTAALIAALSLLVLYMIFGYRPNA
jgi:hypothetical protein